MEASSEMALIFCLEDRYHLKPLKLKRSDVATSACEQHTTQDSRLVTVHRDAVRAIRSAVSGAVCPNVFPSRNFNRHANPLIPK